MATCAQCSLELAEGAGITLQGKNGSLTVCNNCYTAVQAALDEETENPNLVMAALAGVGAAVASALLWYLFVVMTNIQFGLVAVAVGWLVAKGVVLGSGGKRGITLQVLSMVLVLLSLALAEYLVVRHHLLPVFEQEGITDVPLFLPLEMVWLFISESIKGDLLTLLFWAIAMWQAWAIPAPRQLTRA